MTRRQFLVLSGSTGAVMLGGGGLWFLRRDNRWQKFLRFGNEKRWRPIGAAYLDLFPGEKSAEASGSRIFTEAPNWENPEEVRSFIARRVREDFETANVVCIQGWYLSRTEARLAALASLG